MLGQSLAKRTLSRYTNLDDRLKSGLRGRLRFRGLGSVELPVAGSNPEDAAWPGPSPWSLVANEVNLRAEASATSVESWAGSCFTATPVATGFECGAQ